MKAKDLKIDGWYYYHDRTSWLDTGRLGDLAVVVDPTPGDWRNTADGWQRSPHRVGQEVLVRFYDGGPTNPDGSERPGRLRAVRTLELRGPYEQTLEHHRTLILQRREAENKARAAQRERIAACTEAEVALEELGIHADLDGYMYGDHASVEIPASHARLLAAAARHLLATGWQPPASA